MADGRDTRARRPRSDTHAALGELLRQARMTTGRSTRDLAYSSGHISNVESGYATPSRDLVEEYIGLGAERSKVMPLFDRIQHESRSHREVQRRSSRQRAGRTQTRPPQRVGADTDPDEVRRHYRVVRYDVEFDLDARGRLRTVTSTVAIRAAAAGVRFYYTGHQPSSRRRASDMGVTASVGASIAQINLSELGDADVYLDLGRALSPDDSDPHVLSYRLTFADDELADPEIHYVTRPGVEQHRLTARFAAPAMPTRVWLIAARDPMARVDPGAIVVPAGPGVYTHLFERLVPGWTYGFAWQWPQEVITSWRPT